MHFIIFVSLSCSFYFCKKKNSFSTINVQVGIFLHAKHLIFQVKISCNTSRLLMTCLLWAFCHPQFCQVSLKISSTSRNKTSTTRILNSSKKCVCQVNQTFLIDLIELRGNISINYTNWKHKFEWMNLYDDSLCTTWRCCDLISAAMTIAMIMLCVYDNVLLFVCAETATRMAKQGTQFNS